MANILENFNENQLDLIIENEGVSYTFSEEFGDYIRMTVFDNIDEQGIYQFYSNKVLAEKLSSR